MVAVAMGVMLGGYAVGLWGYCLVQGYDVPFTALWSTTWPGGGTGGGTGNKISGSTRQAVTGTPALDSRFANR